MPSLLPGTLRVNSSDGAALEVAAGTTLPAERAMKHRTVFTASTWSLELAYRTASGAPHERRLELLPWDGSSPAGREIAINLWVSPLRVAFVEIGLDGTGERGAEPPAGSAREAERRPSAYRELYRFDPVALRDDGGRLAVTESHVGATIVERGFASAAQSPPGNLRIVARCDACSKAFPMRVHHAGHAGVDFFYCEKCPSVTSVPLTDPRSVGFWKGIESKRLDLVDDPASTPARAVEDNLTVYRAFEEALAPCRCGGRKRFLADLKCPHCAASYVSFRNDLWRRLSEVYVCHVAGHEYVSSDGAWRR